MTTCSQASLAVDEPLDGTGCDAVRHWIGVEYRRPWRAKAVLDNELDEPVRAWLGAMKARPHTRPVLMKQRGRRQGVTVLYADVAEGRVHRFHLADHAAIPSLPWEDLFAGRLALGRTDERPLLVCTHSGRDHCCGLHGAGVARALAKRAGDRIWQCTHLGGHRFAATAVSLPEGVHYGRLRADDAEALLDALDDGRLHDLDQVRGRTAWPVAVQAAEAHLRRAHDLRRLDDVAVAGWSAEGDAWAVTLDAAGRRHHLHVQRVAEHATRPASCGVDPTPVKRWSVSPASP